MILFFGVIAIGCAVPFVWESFQRKKEIELYRYQLKRSLQVFVYALEAGGSFLQALDRVAEQEEAPMRTIWKTLQKEIQLGVPLPQAFIRVVEQVPVEDIRWLAVLVQVTHQTGGSMAPILRTFADSLLKQDLLNEKVQALTAQGRASGYVLCALPVVMFLALAWIAPNLVRPLFETTPGQVMLLVVGGMLSMGLWLIHRISEVRFQ
jgi:tight adherence protein B